MGWSDGGNFFGPFVLICEHFVAGEIEIDIEYTVAFSAFERATLNIYVHWASMCPMGLR